MKKLLSDVAKFQAAYDAPCHASRAAAVAAEDMPPARIQLRLGLVFEEFSELAEAHGLYMENVKSIYKGAVALQTPELQDMPEIADGIGDLIYVLVGMALEYGIPLDHVWDEIQRTNMNKFPDGKVLKNPKTGKVMKPEGWTPPDIKAQLLKTTAAEWHTCATPSGDKEVQEKRSHTCEELEELENR